MARAATVVVNYRELGRVLHSPPVERELRRLAGVIAADARGRAPVASGDYRDSIGVEFQPGGTRPHARAQATDWKAGLMEHYYQVLARAADAVQ